MPKTRKRLERFFFIKSIPSGMDLRTFSVPIDLFAIKEKLDLSAKPVLSRSLLCPYQPKRNGPMRWMASKLYLHKLSAKSLSSTSSCSVTFILSFAKLSCSRPLTIS